MAGMRGSWTVSPSREIGARIGNLRNAKPAISALAAGHAARAEGQMKQQASWTDRTGYARGALFARAEGTDITLGTTNDEYGGHLELGTSRMAARPVILPVAMETAPRYFDDAAQLVGRMLRGSRS